MADREQAPELLLYKPFRLDSNLRSEKCRRPTTHTRPSYSQRTFLRRTGKKRISDFEFRIADLKNKYELRSDELREEISSRYGSDVELMNLKHGIFDEACISVISLGTVHSVERESGREEAVPCF